MWEETASSEESGDLWATAPAAWDADVRSEDGIGGGDEIPPTTDDNSGARADAMGDYGADGSAYAYASEEHGADADSANQYQAKCPCGWCGTVTGDYADAAEEAHLHTVSNDSDYHQATVGSPGRRMNGPSEAETYQTCCRTCGWVSKRGSDYEAWQEGERHKKRTGHDYEWKDDGEPVEGVG
jgi:hypothetical protein